MTRVLRVVPPAIAALAGLVAHELTCVECERTSPPESPVGWRTYLTVDDELATYCPDCAAREFDGGAGT